jgi:hypothetical protein
MEEAEKLAAEARKAEEKRLQKAIEDAQKREAEERARREEEERIKKEADQKAIEEAERKQAELEEKLRKEEEERLARKKRIEEIMARTRGGNKASTASPVGTPKKETSPGSSDDFQSHDTIVNDTVGIIQQPTNAKAQDNDDKPNNTNETITDSLTLNINTNSSFDISKENTNGKGKTTTNGLPHSPIINGQDVSSSLGNSGTSGVYIPVKPDLLGDISNNQKQIMSSSNDENRQLTDTQAVHDANQKEEKLMNEKNSSNALSQQLPLLDFGSGMDPFDSKINNNASVGVVLGNDQPVLDQIIDLSNENMGSITISKNNHNLSSNDTTSGVKEENSVIGAPIIAFEDSITASTKSDVPSTADLLS